MLKSKDLALLWYLSLIPILLINGCVFHRTNVNQSISLSSIDAATAVGFRALSLILLPAFFSSSIKLLEIESTRRSLLGFPVFDIF